MPGPPEDTAFSGRAAARTRHDEAKRPREIIDEKREADAIARRVEALDLERLADPARSRVAAYLQRMLKTERVALSTITHGPGIARRAMLVVNLALEGLESDLANKEIKGEARAKNIRLGLELGVPAIRLIADLMGKAEAALGEMPPTVSRPGEEPGSTAPGTDLPDDAARLLKRATESGTPPTPPTRVAPSGSPTRSA